MSQGSARDLLDILAILNPEDLPALDPRPGSVEEKKRRIIAYLLPIMMREFGVQVRNASINRSRGLHAGIPSCNPRDQR